jgi:hypothetical protein
MMHCELARLLSTQFVHFVALQPARFKNRETKRIVSCALKLVCSLMLASLSAHAQGWKNAGPLPTQPAKVTGKDTPANATPFWRGWTKLVYISNHKKILWYAANPNCCGGTFSNAMFLYDTGKNEWSLAWSHNTITSGGLAGGALADSLQAPSDKHPYHVMAWDSKRNLLWTGFGSAVVGGRGQKPCGDCGVSDFYKFDLTTAKGSWTQVCGNVTVSCQPPPLQEAAAVYDSAHDVVIMYGGLDGGSPTSDTWEYAPATNSWRKICGGKAGCGPPPLCGEGLVYDPERQLVVLFGGAGTHGILNEDTWIYNTQTHKWNKANPAFHPAAQKFPVMDYVPKLQQVVLIGAEPAGAHTWAFDGWHWNDLKVPVGPALASSAKQNQGAYDLAADRFVLLLPSSDNVPPSVWLLTLTPSGSTSR